MPIGVNVLELGLSGLLVSQQGLATTSHNIANVGTPGYSRQAVDIGTGTPVFAGGSYFGTGARALDVRRSYDAFLTQELQSNTSAATDQRVQHGLASQLDFLFSSPETGLAGLLQGFFDAMADAAADPASGTARQVLLDASDWLAQRFRTLDGRLQQTHAGLQMDARATVDEINELASGIAGFNHAISQTRGVGAAPNDLLDQRDELVRQLSERVAVTTLIQDDGSLNVFIGSGQPMVVGAEAQRLAVVPGSSDPSAIGIMLMGSGGSGVNVTGQIHGGQLGALIEFEGGLLADAERALGQIALGMAERLNAQHRLGVDQNGELGGDLFTDINDPRLTAARAVGRAANSGSAELAVTLDSVAALKASDYLLAYDGAEYRLIRQSDNQLVGSFASLPQTFATEGFSIALRAGAMAAGDVYSLRPSAGAAREMRIVPADGQHLALASPVRSATDPQNLGDARIGPVTVDNLAGAPLPGPIALTYDAGSARFTLTAPPGGEIAYDPDADSGSPLTLSVPGFGDLVFSINGTPADGDRLSVENNLGGVGDNANALALAGLRAVPVLLGGTASFAQGYERAVSNIASRTQGLSVAAGAQEKLLQRAEDERQALSGVNLDEEAAELLRYQQAYEAAARVISVSNELFQTVLRALGG